MTTFRAGLAGVTLAGGLAGLALTGCSVLQVGGGQCVDWVAYDTPSQAAKDAAVVAIVRVQDRSGEADLYGESAHLWSVAVEKVLSGDGIAPGEAVVVASTPETCSGSPYPQGDPLQALANTELVVLLHQEPGGRWRTITPWQGAVPPAGDGGLPDAWPPGTMGSPAPNPQP